MNRTFYQIRPKQFNSMFGVNMRIEFASFSQKPNKEINIKLFLRMEIGHVHSETTGRSLSDKYINLGINIF